MSVCPGGCTFSGQDVGALINNGMNFNIVQSRNSQWMLLSTAQTPTRVDTAMVDYRVHETALHIEVTQGVPWPQNYTLAVQSIATQYHLVFYEGINGVFRRIN